MTQTLPVALLVTSAFLWGLSWWPLKHFNAQGIDGLPLIAVAYGVAAVVLLPWLWSERRRYRGERRLAWLMVLLGGYANLAFAEAMILGEVVRAMMLFYLAPVWGVLGGRVFLGEHIDRQRAVGVVLALAGAFLVLGAWGVLATRPTPVDFLAITAGMAFALNNVATRAAQRIPTATKSGVVFAGCALMALLLMGAQATPMPVVPASGWASLAGFGLGWLLLATLLTQWAVTRLETGRASIILITELLVAVVSATLIGGETLGSKELAGGTLIFAAALIEARRA
ncbi:MAG: DMT family transporter [Gammaproteobacteria bacterium]|nr:DMT family transporter [Gammaproteobacteria bacterium]